MSEAIQFPPEFTSMTVEEHEAEIERLQYEAAELKVNLMAELEDVEVLPYLEGLGVDPMVLEVMEYSLGCGTFGELRNETTRLRLEAAAMHQKAADLAAERKAS